MQLEREVHDRFTHRQAIGVDEGIHEQVEVGVGLQNHKKHAGSVALDPLSSAGSFDGFASARPVTFRSVGPPCVVRAETWLLRIG